ncbi:radical SAM/SPASM domain-containing protein [Geomonas sp.]|uniref:radical SAM/SPASM domain-containing protein n=1 Tax=Geomonas sp. TaxID=2651584 RepID=UPI002B482838|nr:radical SAM protein [Geomonas sp.]HJV34032.1 radical SAM protein [Geomonas sp.]
MNRYSEKDGAVQLKGMRLRKTLQQSGLRAPKTLTLALTKACNLSCSHCWVDAEDNCSSRHFPRDKAAAMIWEFAELGGEGVRLTGGEPLCHPAWLDLLRLSVAAGFPTVILQTNGMLLDDDKIAALRELAFPGFIIQISLDGATPAAHDLVRGAGSYKELMAAVDRLVRAGLGPHVSFFFSEMRHNIHEIPAVLRLAEKLGIGSVATGTLVACGRAAEQLVVPPEPDQYLRLLETFYADPEFRRLYDKLGTMAALEWRCCDSPRGEGCTFVENPYITSDGRLYPCVLCHADPYSVTGLTDKSLAEAFLEGVAIWSALREASNRRAEENAKCRECSERLTCAGGCLGRAWMTFGDPMATDDRCELRRAVCGSQSWENLHTVEVCNS